MSAHFDSRRRPAARWSRPFTAAWLCALLVLLHCTTAPIARGQGRAGGLTEEEQAFQAAESAFKENQDDEALKLYERVTNINPARGDAWMKRAVILYKRQKYADAVTVLTRARELIPDDPSLTGQLGLTLYRMNKTDAAVAMLEEAVAKTPDAYQFQLQLGQYYVKINDGKRAVAAFEAYFKARPEGAAIQDPQVKALSGVAYYLDKQYPEAQRDLEIVLRSSPNDVSARSTLGAVYTARGEWSKGIALYDKLGAETERQPSILLNLATCELRLHRNADAEKNALAYTGARPSDAAGFVLLGDIRAERHDYSHALEAWAAARKLDPNVADVSSREGVVLLKQKQWSAAARALEDARKAKPDDIDVLAALGDAYVATQQPPAKLNELAGELGRHPEPQAQQGAGVLLYAAGDDERALKAFQAAATAAPRSYRPRAGQRLSLNRLAGAAVAHGDLAKAEELLRSAMTIDGESVVTARNLGLVLLLEGKFAEAEKALLKARERVDKDMVVNRLLGRAAMGQARRDDAIKYLEVAAQSALKARGNALAEIYSELGPLYMDKERYDLAVLALETAVKEAQGKAIKDIASRNLALALLRRGLDRIGEPREADSALDDIGKAAAAHSALSSKESGAIGCAYALAALKAGKPQTASDALARAAKEGGCSLKAPYDRVGLELFTAYAAYREGGSPARRETAARQFQKIQGKAPPQLGDVLRDLTRSSYELEGVDLYGRGDKKRAAVALRTAARITSRGEHRELDNNLAVLDLDDGKVNDAVRAFEALGNKPPEALVNLGVVRDRDGDSRKALEFYKRAVDRGARSPRLREWIDVKERVFARAAGAK